MKLISMIIGHRKPCCYCGVMIRTVLVPTMSDRWQICEDFAETPSQIVLHDCPRRPSKVA